MKWLIAWFILSLLAVSPFLIGYLIKRKQLKEAQKLN